MQLLYDQIFTLELYFKKEQKSAIELSLSMQIDPWHKDSFLLFLKSVLSKIPPSFRQIINVQIKPDSFIRIEL